MVIDCPHPELVPQLRQLWRLAFGDSEAFLDSFYSTAFSPDHCRCTEEEGQVTATLYWFDCGCYGQKLAYLYAVATHPDHREKGLCRTLMADTHAHLAARGYAGSLLVPEGEGLRRMYRGMGYRDCTTVSEFDCTAGDDPVPLRAVCREEYAGLRRSFLPGDAVIQEGKNLDLLEKLARFYTGPGFLLAAGIENGDLFGMELLGDSGAAPGILNALGCIRGTFRTSGGEEPFAMFRPLTPGIREPGYFGLAFD